MKINSTIVMRFISMSDWRSESLWDEYLHAIENCFEDSLYKLDNKDPLIRKSNQNCSDSQFITKMGSKESNRVLFGSFTKEKVEFDIALHKEMIDDYGEACFNSISFHIQVKKFSRNVTKKIVNLFEITNKNLNCFYSFADYDFRFRHLKTPARRLNVDKELAGIFWLTYFSKQYVDFYKLKEKLDGITLKENDVGGIIIQMSDTPDGLDEQHYKELEEQICSRAFFRNSECNQVGEYVIPLENIK